MPESDSEPEPRSEPGPETPRRGEGDGSERGPLWHDPAQPRTARERRVAAVVEAFLRDVRAGGGLDPEPYLASHPELRGDLEPLLLAVLRLELSAGRTDAPEARPEQGGTGAPGTP